MTKVCILTAGVGSRMLPLTTKINKAILPLGEKAVISHIIDKFSRNAEFVIATGYLSDTVETYLKFAYPEHNFTFVQIDKYLGDRCGPGYSLLQCERFLQEPFYFVSCDTVIDDDLPNDIMESGNWIGVAYTDTPISYCTVSMKKNNVSELHDKVLSGSNSAFIGLAKIQNYKIFFSGLKQSISRINGEPQITGGLEAIIKHSNTRAIEFTWYDTGNKLNYNTAQKHFNNEGFDFSKTDEYLYFNNGKVLKYFTDHKIAEKRFARSKTIKDFAPKVLQCKDGFYVYDYINGLVLYDCDLENLIEPLLDWLHDDFWLKKDLKLNEKIIFKEACLKFYKDKTYARLKDFYQKETRQEFKIGTVNGDQILPLNKLLKHIDWNDLTNGIPVRFHGDLQFDNILITKNGKFKLIDWRQDFAGLIDYGDIYYDLAKLLGGILIPYKSIKSGNFSFNFSNGNSEFNLPQIPSCDKIKHIYYQHLDKIGVDKIKVSKITALIFLNMAPLHEYPFSNLLYAMGRYSLAKALDGQAL